MVNPKLIELHTQFKPTNQKEATTNQNETKKHDLTHGAKATWWQAI